MPLRVAHHRKGIAELRRSLPQNHGARKLGVLAARGDVSYYHFLIDVLPRLAILEEPEHAADLLYMPASLPFQKQLIDLLAIPPERQLVNVGGRKPVRHVLIGNHTRRPRIARI